MASTRRIALAALTLAVIVTVTGTVPLAMALPGIASEAGPQRTSFRLISALGAEAPSIAQSEVQPLDSRRDAFSSATPPAKSSAKAFLYSALAPGAGQLYVGAKRGYVQIAGEVGFLAAYFLTRNDAQDTRDRYREEVRAHVIFQGPTKFDDWDTIEDFEHATLFDNWHNVYTDNNGQPLDRVGQWYWDDRAAFKDDTRTTHDSSNREVALSLREDANDKFQLARTFLGVVILNHVVSAIDARIATKRYNKTLAAQAAAPRSLELNLQTIFSANDLRSRVVLSKRF